MSTLSAALRTAARLSRGDRPFNDDLYRILLYVRGRIERGLPPVPPRLTQALPRSSRSDPVHQLERLQARKLRRTVEYAYRYVPFYRTAFDSSGVKPADIQDLGDIAKLPILRRDQLAANTENLVSTYPGLDIIAFTQTSGTSGQRLRTYLSRSEVEYYALGEAILGLVSGVLTPRDIVQSHLSLDISIEVVMMAYATRLTGSLLLGYGIGGTLDEHLDSILLERHIPGKKPRVSRLIISPSHLWALTRRAQERGLDCRASGLESITVGGAMVSDDLKALVREVWGLEVSEGYGLAESSTTLASQCPQSDRLHLSDFLGYAEALDPVSAEPVEPGKPGVLVVTNFYPDRETMPLLRYWTDDLVILAPTRRCVCGATATQIMDIVGRADRMVVVGGLNFYPQEIGDSLLAFPELVQPPRFSLCTEERPGAQYAVLDVELAVPLQPHEQEQLEKRIVDQISISRYWQVRLGAVRVLANLCTAGSLEHPFAYKHTPPAVGTPPH